MIQNEFKDVKRCPSCKTFKIPTRFCMDKQRPDGRRFYCRECTKNGITRHTIPRDVPVWRKVKKCSSCGEIKDKCEFYRHKGIGYSSQCRECSKESIKQYKKPVKRLYTRKRYRYDYEMTPEKYTELCDRQQGKCAICGGKNKSNRQLGVDHNHETGEIRELLCQACNVLIGFAKEDTNILSQAMKYLNKHGKK